MPTTVAIPSVGSEHLQPIHPARSRLLLVPTSDRVWAWRIDLVRAKAYGVKTSVYSGRATKVRLVKLGNLLKSLVESEKFESTSELKGGSNPRGRSLRLAPFLGDALS